MPSTYTTNLGIELPADGEQDGVWGDVVNDNMNIVDRAINGSLILSLSGTTSTLTTSDGALSNGQYKALILGGTPSGTHTITIAPNDAQKIYFVYNLSGQSVVFYQGSGTTVTIANNDTAIIYSDGGGSAAGVVNLTDHFAMNSVKITGGTITGITDLAVADGGTGASTAANALINLGLTATAAELNYTAGVTSAIQTQLNNKQPLDAELTAIAALAVTDSNFIVGNGTTWVAESGATARTSLGLGSIATQASSAVAITGGTITGITDLAIADGGTGASTASQALINLGLTATATEINYTDGVTSAIQTQLDAKQATITGAATTVTSSNLTASRAAVSNASGKIDVSAVTTTELGYVSGVTSAIQTQMNTKAPSASPTLTTPTLSSPTTTGTVTVNGGSASWTIVASGTNLTFSYGGVAKFRLQSDGAFIAAGDITAFGAP